MARACGLRGLFGVDFLLRDAVPWLAEINPRYPASTEIYELAWNVPLLHWHQVACEAFDGESADDEAARGATSSRVAIESHASAELQRSIVAQQSLAPRHAAIGKGILYSPGDFVFPHDAERDAFAGSPDWHAAKDVGVLRNPESESRRASEEIVDSRSPASGLRCVPPTWWDTMPAWSEAFRLPRLADVPRAGASVPAGQPVCSVLVAGASVQEVEVALGEAVARLSSTCRAAGGGTGTPVGRS
jgi:hypothetical protein